MDKTVLFLLKYMSFYLFFKIYFVATSSHSLERRNLPNLRLFPKNDSRVLKENNKY